jgi:PAS domain-containing protein
MFTHQLVAEVVPSIAERAPGPSLNDADAIRRLLEQHTGFGQFRVVLPGTVSWAPGTLGLRERSPLVEAATLKDLILAYLPEDRSRVVDAIDLAMHERRGFRFNARMMVRGSVRVIETIGDVRIGAGGEVTELFGLARDVSSKVENEAMATSRARLIRHLVEDIPVPVAVLDRALRVVACSGDWARAYGLPRRHDALSKPLGRLVEVSGETTAAIIEALNGRTAHVGLWFHSGELRKRVWRQCAVIPWQCGSESAGGVLMVIGGSELSYASAEIADRALGRSAPTLMATLAALPVA